MQIGIIGSAADLPFGDDAIRVAQKLGREIARRNDILVFGAEKDCMSLPTYAAVSAREPEVLLLV